MTHWQLFIALTIAGGTVAAVFSAWSSFRKRWHRLLATVLRSLFGAILIIALLEPAVTVHRLPERNRTVPILIDASESMTLFDADSVVRTLRETMASFTATSASSARQPVFFLFGDSTRHMPQKDSYAATDRLSLFPETGTSPLLQSYRDMLIISDANWSNATPVAAPATAQDVWYLPLRRTRTTPTLSCTLPDSVISAASAPFDITIPCSGTTREKSTITVHVTNNDTTIATATHTTQGGPFHHDFTVQLPGAPAGLHCYRISVVNKSGSVHWTGYLPHQAVRGSFSYSIASSAPSLDERFLRSALAGRTEFTRAANRTERRTSDCRFIIGTRNTPPPPVKSLDVYLGTVPGAAPATNSTGSYSQFTLGTLSDNPFSLIPLTSLPPVAVKKPGKDLTVVTTWIAAQQKSDTVPLVFKGVHDKRLIIGCGIPAFWRWDFLPLAHAAGEAETFQFTRRLLDATAATLRQLRTDTLLLYPGTSPGAGTPCRFILALPSAYLPHLRTITPSVSIRTGNGNEVFDTTLNIVATGRIFHETLLPPLDTGTYTATCSLAVESRIYTATRSFQVERHNAELSVTRQNEQALRIMGQPFSLDDTLFFVNLFRDDAGMENREPSLKHIRIRRAWWMLLLLFLLLGGEWWLRRAARLD